MTLLVTYFFLALFLSFICSLLEAILLSTPNSYASILMKENDIEKAAEFLKKCLQNMVDEKIDISKLIITKSLNGFYKNLKWPC